MRTKWLHLWYGPDLCRHLDRVLFVGVLPGPAPGEGMMFQYRLRLEIAWNWLPWFIYQDVVAYEGEHDSSQWTGRKTMIVGIHGWPFVFTWRSDR